MGTFSTFHWLIIAVIVLLLFGNRLPSVMRSLGRGMVEFKKGMEGIEDDVHDGDKRKVEGNGASHSDAPKSEVKPEGSDKP